MNYTERLNMNINEKTLLIRRTESSSSLVTDELASYEVIEAIIDGRHVRLIEDYSKINSENENATSSYDVKSHVHHEGSSFWATVFNLINDVLGAGLVGLPYYVNAIGMTVLPFVLVFFSIITVYTLNTVYYLSKKYRCASYPELCKYSLGVPGYILICILIFIFNFGGFVAGLQIIGTNVPPLLRWSFGFDYWLFHRNYILVLICILFLPLSFWTKISNYTINSFLSFMSLVALTLILLSQCIYRRDEFNKEKITEHILDFKVDTGFLSALGGMSYLFVCHDLSFSVFESFRNATRKRWFGVGLVTISLTLLIFVITGYSGFLMFNNKVQANILDNFEYNSLPANIGRIFISLNIIISVPYYCFMPRLAIYGILGLVIDMSKRRKFFTILTTLLVLSLALVIAELVDDLGNTFELIGGLSAISIAFILPPIIFIKLERRTLPSPKLIIHFFILIFGVLACITSTTSTVINIIIGN